MMIFLRRMARAAALDPALYEEVEGDRRLTGQAVAVILLAGLGGGLAAGWPRPQGILLGVLLALAGWAAWALVTWWVGTRFLAEPQTRADVGELLRTIGFAASPGVVQALGIVPRLRLAATAVAAVWMLAAAVVAVRQALDFRTTGRALAVCAIGWAIQVAAVALAAALFAVTAGPAW
jgi:hypothetical protein